LKAGVAFYHQDVRREQPPGQFDLILCRHVAFTYFSDAVQRIVLNRISELLRADGCLVIGRHESLPTGVPFLHVTGTPGMYRHRGLGLREALPVVTVNPLDWPKFGTAGRALAVRRLRLSRDEREGSEAGGGRKHAAHPPQSGMNDLVFQVNGFGYLSHGFASRAMRRVPLASRLCRTHG
jgi:hypothetical protein